MQQTLARNSVKWGHGPCWEGMDHPEHPRAFNLLISTQITRQKHHGVLICHDNPTRSAAKLQYFLSLWTHSLGNLPSGAHGTLGWDHSMPTGSLTECRRGGKENITLYVWLDLMTWLLACWLHLNISVYKERKGLFVPNGKGRAIIRCHLCQSSLLSVMEAGHLAESEEVKWSESRSVVSNSLWPHGLYSPQNSPGQNTGVGHLSLLQGIFSIQGLNPGFLHCRQILYQLSHKGSPRIVEWVAHPFSRGSSQPRNWTRVSCIAGGLSALQKFSALQADSPALQAGSPALQKESMTSNDIFLWEPPQKGAFSRYTGTFEIIQDNVLSRNRT